MEESKALLEIVRCFIKNKEYISDVELDEEKLYNIAKKNMLDSFLIKWSKNCKSENIKNLIENNFNMQVIKDTNEEEELEKILNRFEELGIKTIVIKGMTLKEAYPQSYMRERYDIDVFVEEKNIKECTRVMMKEFEYTRGHDFEDKHVNFYKPPFFALELHRVLIVKKDIGHQYFTDIWTKTRNYKDYKNIYWLSIEDCYIHCILHILAHFKHTGIIVRQLLDVYLYYEKYKNKFDYEKLNRVFSELKVAEFEENIREIAYKWFGEGKIKELSKEEQFILNGAGDDVEVNYHILEKNGKFNYWWRMFFPKFEIMEEKYKVLKKAPILLPAMYVVRLGKEVFSKKITGRALSMMKMTKDVSKEEIENMKEIYISLGVIKDKK